MARVANWRERLERRFILDLIGDVRGRVVLDISCGDGELAIALSRRGAVVTGIDASVVRSYVAA